MMPEDDLEFISRLFKRNQRVMLVMTAIFALLLLVGVMIGLTYRDKAPAFLGLAGAGGIAAIICLVLSIRYGSVRASLLPILHDHPERINLIFTGGVRYVMQGQQLSRENIVGLRLEDGRIFLIRSLRPHEISKVLDILKRHAPQARINGTSV
jgi:hypothetical protein